MRISPDEARALLNALPSPPDHVQGDARNTLNVLMSRIAQHAKRGICPHCGSTKVIRFDSNNDTCNACGKWFPCV